MNQTSPRIFKQLHQPSPRSHKGDNGRLLIIAGSDQYHGSLLYALTAASRLVDLIYVLTTPGNQALIKKLKSKTAEFIPVQSLKSVEGKIDCVLIGPGMGRSKQTAQLTVQILKSKLKAVLDADSLTTLTPTTLKLLNSRHILTPHAGEFQTAFNLPPNAKNLQQIVKRYGATIILKSHFNLIGSPSHPLMHNPSGNPGLTKGGTGDVLAGLTAALFCKNNAFTSACSALYLNGAAGDALYKKVGPYYNTQDLVNQIPVTLNRLTK